MTATTCQTTNWMQSRTWCLSLSWKTRSKTFSRNLNERRPDTSTTFCIGISTTPRRPLRSNRELNCPGLIFWGREKTRGKCWTHRAGLDGLGCPLASPIVFLSSRKRSREIPRLLRHLRPLSILHLQLASWRLNRSCLCQVTVSPVKRRRRTRISKNSRRNFWPSTTWRNAADCLPKCDIVNYFKLN